MTRRLPEPNATFRVGADGETGACKGLTLSNSSPVLLRKPGLFLESRRCGLGCHAKRHDPPLRCWSFPHIRCPAAGVPNSPKYAAIRNRCGSPKIAGMDRPNHSPSVRQAPATAVRPRSRKRRARAARWRAERPYNKSPAPGCGRGLELRR